MPQGLLRIVRRAYAARCTAATTGAFLLAVAAGCGESGVSRAAADVPPVATQAGAAAPNTEAAALPSTTPAVHVAANATAQKAPVPEGMIRLPGSGIIAPRVAATPDFKPPQWPANFKLPVEITVEVPELPAGIEGPSPPIEKTEEAAPASGGWLKF